MAWESTDSAVPFTDFWRHEDAAGGTRVTFHREFPSVGGAVLGRLVDPLVARVYVRGFRANLARLKQVLESPGS